MARSGDVPLPPGFEDFASASAPSSAARGAGGDQATVSLDDEVDPETLQNFYDFIRGSGPAPAAPEAPARGQQRAVSSGLVNEGSAEVEIVRWVKEDAGSKAGTSFPVDDHDSVDVISKLLDTEASFEGLGLSQDLLRGVYDMGFVKPSKIQASSLPIITYKWGGRNGPSLGGNMIAQAQNGSGKTATFALALLSAVDVSDTRPQALVVCPTRELARQNETVIAQLGKFMLVRTQLAVPSQDRIPRNAACHVIVGTPGKIWDLTKRRVIDVSAVRVFVLDEADQMLDQSNAMGPQVTEIRKLLPLHGLQVLFFSATYPDDVRRFAESLVPKAYVIKVKKTELTVSTVTQLYVRCDSQDDKFARLAALYGAMTVGQSVVFVNARRKAFELARKMREAGHAVSLICGTQTTGEERMDPALRDQVMEEFRSGVTRVLVATDVLSRGIDVPQVTLVVNYELPVSYGTRGVDMETYLHRVGRTGRFGLRGIAVNLVTDAERPMIDEVCSYFECKIPEMGDDLEALEDRLRELR